MHTCIMYMYVAIQHIDVYRLNLENLIFMEKIVTDLSVNENFLRFVFT